MYYWPDYRSCLKGRSTVAVIPDSADGQFLISATTEEPHYIHADHLEVSLDGK